MLVPVPVDGGHVADQRRAAVRDAAAAHPVAHRAGQLRAHGEPFPFGAVPAQQPAGGAASPRRSRCSPAPLAAYAFARLQFRGRNALFAVYLATLMVPHAGHDRAALHRDALPRAGQHLPRAAAARHRVGVRHLPAPPGVPGPAARDGGGRVHRRRRPLDGLPAHRPAAVRAGPRDVRDLRLHGQLERVPVAAGHRAAARTS